MPQEGEEEEVQVLMSPQAHCAREQMEEFTYGPGETLRVSM